MSSLVKYYYTWKKRRTRTSLMDRQARKTAKEEASEQGSDAGSNSESDPEEAQLLVSSFYSRLLYFCIYNLILKYS